MNVILSGPGLMALTAVVAFLMGGTVVAVFLVGRLGHSLPQPVAPSAGRGETNEAPHIVFDYHDRYGKLQAAADDPLRRDDLRGALEGLISDLDSQGRYYRTLLHAMRGLQVFLWVNFNTEGIADHSTPEVVSVGIITDHLLLGVDEVKDLWEKFRQHNPWVPVNQPCPVFTYYSGGAGRPAEHALKQFVDLTLFI